MKEELKAFIERLRREDKINHYDEEATKQAIVLRVLSMLGWDIFNIEEVTPQYYLRDFRVDYSLRLNESNKVFIEVKRVGTDLEPYQEQLLKYSFLEGVDVAILTNGITWWFYQPMQKGSWQQRRFSSLNIINQELEEVVQKFIDYLSKESIKVGLFEDKVGEDLPMKKKNIATKQVSQITSASSAKEEIFITSSKFKKVEINSYTLKVEKENAEAMIEGFWKDGDKYYVTIFTAHKHAKSMENDFRLRPKLLTVKKGKPRAEYPLSSIGRRLQSSNYIHSVKYLAVLDTIYYIENHIKIWNVLCSNGIFDIWEPRAPFNSLEGKKVPMILLLRIFEIDTDLSDEIIPGQYFDSIKPREVKIVKPIIPANENDPFSRDYYGKYYFEDIVNLLEEAVSGHLRGKEKVCDSSQIYL